MSSMNDCSHMVDMTLQEVKLVLERKFVPFFQELETNKEILKLFETALKQMPEFKRLQSENEELRNKLANDCPLPIVVPTVVVPVAAPIVEQVAVPTVAAPIVEQVAVPTVEQVAVPIVEQVAVPLLPSKSENTTKHIVFDVFEKPQEVSGISLSEEDIYKIVNLNDMLPPNLSSVGLVNKSNDRNIGDIVHDSDVDDELDAYATTEDEDEESEEEEEEAEEEEEEEEEASEAAEEEEEEEEAADEEASEAEEEEAEAEEEASEAVASEAVASEVALETSEAEEEEEEEVFIVEIAGRGKFYTTNEVNGDIYSIINEDDIGEPVGKFINKVPTFN